MQNATLPLPAEPVQAATLVCDGREAVRTGIPSAIAAAPTPHVRQEDETLILESEATAPALVQYAERAMGVGPR